MQAILFESIGDVETSILDNILLEVLERAHTFVTGYCGEDESVEQTGAAPRTGPFVGW